MTSLGSKYDEDGLKRENVEYFYSKKKEELPTGTCLILVTPDSETNNVYILKELQEKLMKTMLRSDAIKEK